MECLEEVSPGVTADVRFNHDDAGQRGGYEAHLGYPVENIRGIMTHFSVISPASVTYVCPGVQSTVTADAESDLISSLERRECSFRVFCLLEPRVQLQRLLERGARVRFIAIFQVRQAKAILSARV